MMRNIPLLLVLALHNFLAWVGTEVKNLNAIFVPDDAGLFNIEETDLEMRHPRKSIDQRIGKLKMARECSRTCD